MTTEDGANLDKITYLWLIPLLIFWVWFELFVTPEGKLRSWKETILFRYPVLDYVSNWLAAGIIALIRKLKRVRSSSGDEPPTA